MGSEDERLVEYDPKPRVMPVDKKSGKYALRWINTDGKELSVIYQRHDAIDALVKASVLRSESAPPQCLYVYSIENLPTSGQHLSQFSVQNFASDAKPVKRTQEYVGKMSQGIPEFKEGNWTGSSVFHEAVVPGREAQVKLQSSAPPGLVECRVAGGAFGITGAGGDLPQELANVLLKYDHWPKGHTIGPIDELKGFSKAQYARYISDRLERFKQLGWITERVLPWYQQNLSALQLGNVYERASQDLKNRQITTEVLAMIEAAMRRK